MTSGRSIHSICQDNDPVPLNKEKVELDSHADTVVAGAVCRVLELTEKACDVYPFLNDYEPMNQAPVAKVATAYDHPLSGETFILIFGQALYLGDKLRHTLIFPNQLRFNGVIVDDIPKHLSHDGKSTNSIYLPNQDVRLPLKLRGVISYLDTRDPTEYDLNNCRWLVMTNNLDWDSYDDSFAENKGRAHNENGYTTMSYSHKTRQILSSAFIVHVNH
jgi:hypothetical protein